MMFGCHMNDEHKSRRAGWGFGRRGPGFGPGFGPPWARFGGAGGPRTRMFAQGDLRLLLLALIADKPSHGYDLIRTIEARFGGNYSPSPGTIYPTLTLLEEQGLIAVSAEAAGKKSYAVTPEGRAFLEEHGQTVEALMSRIDVMARGSGHAPMPESIMHAIHTLRGAVMSRFGKWEGEEESRVRKILEQAARDIASGSKPAADK